MIARSTAALFGTDETTGTSIANNATGTGSEKDVLGDDTSVGEMAIFALITSTVTAGSIDIKINPIRVSGQVYSKIQFERSIAPINGTQKVPLGRIPASRYMNSETKNNATGASATVSILYELFKLS